MSYKLLPRFYYTLSTISYFRSRKLLFNDFYKNRVSLNSARTALRLLLSSISNDSLTVGVQAYTCHTVFQAISKAGHSPIFIDIDTNFNLDLNDLKNKVNRIDVLIITHTFGFPEQIDKIKQIVGDIIIIEDGAHAFLSKSRKRFIGELADAAIFSTGLAKFPAIGTGGFCLINKKEKFPLFDEEYAKLKNTGFIKQGISFIKILIYSIMMKSPLYGIVTYKLGKKLDSKIDFADKFSFNEGLSMNWDSRVFEANYISFKQSLIKQQLNANMLYPLLNMSIRTVKYNLNDNPSFYTFPILIKNRNELFDELLYNNIEAGKHFSRSLIWAEEFGYVKGYCPKTEEIVNQIITLPIHSGVRKEIIKRIAKIVNKYE